MRISKNLIFVLGDKIIKLIVGFLLSAYIARYFGPKDFGQINLFMVILSFLQVINNFGLDEIIVRDLTLNPQIENTNKIISTVLALRFYIYLVILLVSIVYINIMSYSYILKLIYYIFLFDIFFNIFTCFQLYFRYKKLNDVEVVCSQKSYFIRILSRVIFLILKGNMIGYAVIFILEKFFFVCFLFNKYIKYEKFKFLLSNEYLKKIIKPGSIIMISNLLVLLYSRLDQFMISEMLGVEKLGIYSVGVKISELIQFIPYSIVGVYIPKILLIKQNKSKQDYINKIIGITQLNIFITIFFAISIFFIGDDLIVKIYGNEYKEAFQILQVYCWGQIFISMGYSMNQYLIIEDRNKLFLYSTLMGILINIILNYILIKKYGLIGATYATLISQIFANYIFFIFLKEKIHFKMRSKSLLLRIEILKDTIKDGI